ncbi:cyclic AMP-dependent transcription factor ATF-6 alpha [Clarias gariepinus]|uniref:cyclic AMP-dependent transcription factor ATF-6 alpha n=1 Tax=Clarias gariepinus TaxID=13013 RepID=UPI00234DE509|nr:cyclic AMP-dependent transcription factor ATF-6 alpha [Clarias gariepinus]
MSVREMSRELQVNVEDQSSSTHTVTAASDRSASMAIDQDGEWDISLFDELDGLGDAEELLQALENAGYIGSASDVNLDMDLPVWSSEAWGDTSSMCTEGDILADSSSPTHTFSSVSSPSAEAQSPCSLFDDAPSPLSPQSQPSPLSVCSDSSSSVDLPPEKKLVRKTNQTKVKPVLRPIHLSPKVSIQPKPLITALPITQTAGALQTKTIIIQPVQATIVPVVKPAPITIQPAPTAGHSTLLSQPTVLQLQSPQVVPAGPQVLSMPSLVQDRPTNLTTPAASLPVLGIPLRNPPSDEDSSMSRRQQRMIKNRESASLSRKKKKEYLLTLEAHLKVALSENEKLKNENGTLKRQLEGLMNENTILKATAPKRRAVCLMVVLLSLAINIAPMSLFKEDGNSSFAAGPSPSSRHLLGFSSDSDMGDSIHDSLSAQKLESMPEEKALMVVKRDPLLLRTPPPPCQPSVNRTKCIKIASELRGWVHRHEAERTKNQRNSSTHSRARTITKMASKKAEVAQIVTVQYTDSSDKHSGNELQVYYAPHHTYSNFFDEINRRGDTFYVISFRRDHLLLPATNHNRGSRPKMSLVLPAMNINESLIKDKEFEVMMQIECEVMDTRILHIKSSSIPPILRVNETGPFYHSAPNKNPASPSVGVLVGSA